jgi:5-methylcytosine-specific restriction endonuclease McrA
MIRDPVQVVTTTVMNLYRNGAKLRSINFGIDRSDVERMIFSPCRYCGRSGVQAMLIGDGRVMHHIGIDRVDNDLPYTKENCVPCCKDCNLAKRCRSMQQFKDWVAMVAAHLKENP